METDGGVQIYMCLLTPLVLRSLLSGILFKPSTLASKLSKCGCTSFTSHIAFINLYGYSCQPSHISKQ